MKHILRLSGILLFVITLAACSKNSYDDTNPPPSTTPSYRADLAGIAETVPNSSMATASFLASYNSYTHTLTYSLTYTGITPTMWHIHKAAIGVSGPVVFDLGTIVPSPLNGTITLNATQLSELDNGMYYVNIHSTAYPDGEIRGQIINAK